MRDVVAFSSAQLPTEHFNARFSEESLAFWVPILLDCAQIEAGHRVLDIGCGTGGFTRAIAEMASAAVTGIEISERFIEFARRSSTQARCGRLPPKRCRCNYRDEPFFSPDGPNN
ncbi:MAG TPA: methyltransferase domain-containing protein [Stellaceae bacterium]|nr:methyltransferase domain-containing protein [Stellaceae bacterium]